MSDTTPSLRRFVLRAFLWLPPSFAAWHFSSPFHAALAGRLARGLIDQLAPGVVAGLEREGSQLVFVTTLEVHPSPGLTAVLLAEVNPLLYTYGLALFVALMLASRSRWRAILGGSAILLVFQAWGIAFDFLSQLAPSLGMQAAAQAGALDWRREAIALGYQVGALLFPSLMPAVLWAAFNRDFLQAKLSGAATRGASDPAAHAQA
jgi:hypothetical protein